MRLTKNQSLYLGFGTIVLFFGFASIQISRNARDQRPAQSPALQAGASQSDGPTVPLASSSDRGRMAEGETPSVGTALPSGEQPRFELKDFHRSETKDGRKVWEVTAKRGEYYPATNSAKIYDAILFLFREDDNTMELRAGEALIHLSGTTLSKAETSGGVVIKYNKDGEMVTDEAVYDRTNETVSAPGFVTITNDSMHVTGTVLDGDLKTNEFILRQDVKSVLKPKSERKHADIKTQ